jgi:hypothetical protein
MPMTVAEPSDSDGCATLIADTGSGRALGGWWRGRRAVAETTLVSRGGCITSALTDWSAVEVVGAVLGAVSTRAGRGVGTVAAGSIAAADRSPAGQAGAVGAGVCAAERRRAAPSPAPGAAVAQHGRTRGDQPWGGRRRAVSADRGPAGASPSTVSRELVRNGGRHRYRAQVADAAAFRRAQRPKLAKLVTQPRLRAVVEAKLALRWSPQQIAGWLPLAYPLGSGDAGVARDHLPVAVHAEPRRAPP